MTSAPMTVHCPSCNAAFPVDPRKVPERGVHARCSVCARIFPVRRPAGWTDAEATQTPEESRPLGSTDTVGGPGAEAGAGAATAPPDAVPSAAEAGTRKGPEPAPAPAFGRRDPHEKAARLARVLISDMITYNRERHDRAIRAGTLREDFDEEIKKSWAEYVDQVGEEMAESTSYFTDALNDILARGRPVF